MFTEFAAQLNDRLILAEHEIKKETTATGKVFSFLNHTKYFLAEKFVGVIVFPLFAALDFSYYLLKMPIQYTWSVIKEDSQLKEQSKRTGEVAMKCFCGMMASPIASLLSSDLVTHHFLPKAEKKDEIASGGKLYTAAGIEVSPSNLSNLMRIVNTALKQGQKITIAGAHMSQSKNTLPMEKLKSFCINMQKLNAVSIDPKTKIAKVQAGATWKDVQAKANDVGLSVKVMQASNIFSIGGSLSVNCHGWDHRTGSLSNTIQSITIINGKGMIEKLTPKDELFGLVIGGHGLFGIIIEAEIQLSENKSLVSWGKNIAPKDYVNYFQTEILPNENHEMHLYRLSLDPKNLLKEGVAVTYSKKTKKHLPGTGVATLEKDESKKGSALDRVLIHVARRFASARALYWKKESHRILDEERLSKNEIMRPPINAAFNASKADAEWLQEYFVKGKELAPFLEKLSQILMKNNVPLLNASVRYVKKDEISQMAYAKGEDHFAVVLFFNQSLAKEEVEKTRKWVQEVIHHLTQHDGSYYLPYQHFANPDQFLTCYPNATKVMESKKKYDPQETFTNGLYQDYFLPVIEQKRK